MSVFRNKNSYKFEWASNGFDFVLISDKSKIVNVKLPD